MSSDAPNRSTPAVDVQDVAARPTPVIGTPLTVPGPATTPLNGRNKLYRVNRTGGWRGISKNLGDNVTDQLAAMNADGFRLVFMTQDKWSLFQHIGAFFHAVFTLGISGRKPGLLLIGEKVDKL